MAVFQRGPWMIGEHLEKGEWKGGHIKRAFRKALAKADWDQSWFDEKIDDLVNEIKQAEEKAWFTDTDDWHDLHTDSGVEIYFSLTKKQGKIYGHIYVHWYMKS